MEMLEKQSSNSMPGRQLQVLLLSDVSSLRAALTISLNKAGCDTYTVASLDDMSASLAAMRFDAVVVGADFADMMQAILDMRGNRMKPIVVPGFASVKEVTDPSKDHSGAPVALTGHDIVAAIERLLAEDVVKRPSENPVNVEKFLSMVDADRSFFDSMSAEFLEDAVIKLPQLQAAVSSGDSQRVEFLAHTLKSVLGIFGADDAAAAARELESAGREGRIADAEKTLPLFLDYMAAIDHQLRRLLKTG